MSRKTSKADPKKRSDRPEAKSRVRDASGELKPRYIRKTAPVPALVEKVEVVKPETPPIFSTKLGRRIDTAAGGKEAVTHDIEILAMERAIMYPSYSPTAFLTEIKGYSISQCHRMLDVKPSAEWDTARERILNGLTENVVKRHVDLIAETNDTHIKASKLAMARAIEMLSKLEIASKEEWIMDPTVPGGKKKVITKALRSVDLMNCATAIKTAQEVYRKAMGLPNDEGGLAQIIDKIQLITQNNLHIHTGNNTLAAENTSPLEKALMQLSYEDVRALIDKKRDRAAAIEVESKAVSK
jgi:hypothetical protein